MSSVETEDAKLRQSPDRLADRKIAAVTVGSIAITTIALVVAWVLLEQWAPPERHEGGAPPPAPSTIATLEQSLILHTERGEELHQRQRASLTRLGWVDRDAGIARIPVERAIDVLAASPPPVDSAVEDMGQAQP